MWIIKSNYGGFEPNVMFLQIESIFPFVPIEAHPRSSL